MSAPLSTREFVPITHKESALCLLAYSSFTLSLQKIGGKAENGGAKCAPRPPDAHL